MLEEMRWTKDVPKAILRVAAICMAVSVTSVLCAYFWVPSDAWTFEYRHFHYRLIPTWMPAESWFGPTIVYIELSHTVVIAALSMFLLGFAYRAEFVRTAHVLFLRQYSDHKYVLLRTAAVVCAIAVLTILLNHHLRVGPDELKNLYERRDGKILATGQSFVTYHLPYMVYFPYSFVNFFCGMTPILAVCLLAVPRDIAATFADSFRVLDAKKQDRTEEQVLSGFKQFYERCAERCGRYSSLALGLGAFAVFEREVGVYSTTRSAASMASLGIQVVSLYGVSILAVIVLYVAAFGSTQSGLQRSGADARKFAKENNILAFLKDLWNRYASLYIGLGILCNIIFPWIPRLANYVEHITQRTKG